MLQAWAKRWEDRIERGCEYEDGSLEQAWKGPCTEAKSVAVVHLKIEKQITDGVIPLIGQWKRKNYTKSFLRWRETKRIEEEFEKAQKPWARLRIKAERGRKLYFDRCAKLDAIVRKQKILDEDRLAQPQDISKLKVCVVRYIVACTTLDCHCSPV
jgi:hypothetical protein